MRLDQISIDPMTNPARLAWLDTVFQAKAVEKGGVVRRAVRDVEHEVGRAVFLSEVRRRGFHMVECGGQFIVICNTGHMQVIC
jgi:hypothetical protein